MCINLVLKYRYIYIYINFFFLLKLSPIFTNRGNFIAGHHILELKCFMFIFLFLVVIKIW